MRVAGYVRVSSEQQLTGKSLADQRRVIETWCEREGHKLISVYADEAVSAATDDLAKRPALTSLLTDAASNRFDLAVATDLDRWARNSTAQGIAFTHLRRCGVDVKTTDGILDLDDPLGRFQALVLGGANELQSAMTGLKVRRRHQSRARDGLTNGRVPFGYALDDQGRAVTTEASEDVLQVFRMRAAGESFGACARYLNERGHLTTAGMRFRWEGLKYLLANPFYTGVVALAGDEHEGAHEAIVPRDLWERVQARRHRKIRRRNPTDARGLLQGRLVCCYCGHSVHSDRHYKTGNPRYRERHDGGCATVGRSISASKIDAPLIQVLSALSFPAAVREAWLEEYTAPSDDSHLFEHRRRLVRAYADGGFTDIEYETRLSELDRQIAAARPASREEADGVADLLANLDELIAEATDEQRQHIVSHLVERAVVDLKERILGGIVAQPAFASLLSAAVDAQPESELMLLPAGRDLVGGRGLEPLTFRV